MHCKNESDSYLAEAKEANSWTDMITIIACFDKDGNQILDTDPSNTIINDLEFHIYMSYPDLYEIIIDCELDMDKVEECLKFMLRHELGHAIAYTRDKIGKTLGTFMRYSKKVQKTYDNFPKDRTNASNKTCWKNRVAYMKLPWENAANKAVGITMDDIREQFIRLNGPIK